MTNGSGGSALAAEILRAIASVYQWPGYLQAERVAVPVPRRIFEEVAGTYLWPSGDEVVVTIEGDALIARVGNEPRVRIWATSDSTFFTEDTGTNVRVERDSAGRVAALVVSQPNAEIRVPRVR